jgi:hypothetical protein
MTSPFLTPAKSYNHTPITPIMTRDIECAFKAMKSPTRIIITEKRTEDKIKDVVGRFIAMVESSIQPLPDGKPRSIHLLRSLAQDFLFKEQAERVHEFSHAIHGLTTTLQINYYPESKGHPLPETEDTDDKLSHCHASFFGHILDRGKNIEDLTSFAEKLLRSGIDHVYDHLPKLFNISNGEQQEFLLLLATPSLPWFSNESGIPCREMFLSNIPSYYAGHPLTQETIKEKTEALYFLKLKQAVEKCLPMHGYSSEKAFLSPPSPGREHTIENHDAIVLWCTRQEKIREGIQTELDEIIEKAQLILDSEALPLTFQDLIFRLFKLRDSLKRLDTFTLTERQKGKVGPLPAPKKLKSIDRLIERLLQNNTLFNIFSLFHRYESFPRAVDSTSPLIKILYSFSPFTGIEPIEPLESDFAIRQATTWNLNDEKINRGMDSVLEDEMRPYILLLFGEIIREKDVPNEHRTLSPEVIYHLFQEQKYYLLEKMTVISEQKAAALKAQTQLKKLSTPPRPKRKPKHIKDPDISFMTPPRKTAPDLLPFDSPACKENTLALINSQTLRKILIKAMNSPGRPDLAHSLEASLDISGLVDSNVDSSSWEIIKSKMRTSTESNHALQARVLTAINSLNDLFSKGCSLNRTQFKTVLSFLITPSPEQADKLGRLGKLLSQKNIFPKNVPHDSSPIKHASRARRTPPPGPRSEKRVRISSQEEKHLPEEFRSLSVKEGHLHSIPPHLLAPATRIKKPSPATRIKKPSPPFLFTPPPRIPRRHFDPTTPMGEAPPSAVAARVLFGSPE